MSINTISPVQLSELVETGTSIDLIDVRTPVEYRAVHVAFARNEPLDQLDPSRLAARRNGSAGPLYVICHSGSRSRQACATIQAAGGPDVVNVEGGTKAWEQAGLPVVRGEQVMSLERQVRIAAGSLVLVGTVLGAFVSPYWIGLAAFVGTGLVFAGLTDTCGMGLLLARMPWNQCAEETKPCCTG